MDIRLLTAADALAYHPLRLRALREEPDAFGADYAQRVGRPIAETAARLRPLDAPAFRFTLGAFADDGKLAGMVTLAQHAPRKERHRATITAMYVAPEARGQGQGKALLRAAIERASARPELEQIHLSVVTTNPAARALYRTLGFVPYGIEPCALQVEGRYLDEDLMVRWLRGAPLP